MLRDCVTPEGDISGPVQELGTEYDRIKNIIGKFYGEKQ